MEYQVEGYRTEDFISTEYKQNYLARMLAGYDDETWNKLKAGRRRTYARAAANLLIDWKSFEDKMKEFDISK
jgi:hypothetical protein